MEDIGKKFIEYTKYKYLKICDQALGVPPPPFALPFDESAAKINLINPQDIKIPDINVKKLIEKRRSVRNYSGKYLTLEELSYLLWCTQGVRLVLNPAAVLKNVPSAGARHPFETFVLVNRVESVKNGLYRYLSFENKLLEISVKNTIADEITEGCLGQDFVKTSAVTFIWVAVPYRTKWRYSCRGYRYLFLDAGHVCQNLYISAESVGCGVCAIAAFSDDDMNNILGLDGKEQFVIYCAAVGKKK